MRRLLRQGLWILAAVALSRRRETEPMRLVSRRWSRKETWLLIVLPFAAAALAGFGAWQVLRVDAPPDPVGLGFDVDTDASSDFGQYVVDVALESQRRTPGSVSPVQTSKGTGLGVESSGCDRYAKVSVSVAPDGRWWLALKATRLKRSVALTTVRRPDGSAIRRVASPQVDGRFRFRIGAKVIRPRASIELARGRARIPLTRSEAFGGDDQVQTDLTGRIPNSVLPTLLDNDLLVSQTIDLTFEAPLVHRRGFRSCYVQVPTLLDPGEADPLGTSGLGQVVAGGTLMSGPQDGRTGLRARNALVDGAASDPPPSSVGTPTWTCKRPSLTENDRGRLRPDCHSIAAINRPNASAHLQLLVIILGAFISGGLMGGLAGIGRWLRRRPTEAGT